MIDRVELNLTVEHQPLWLAFRGAELDYLSDIPVAFRPGALNKGRLAPDLAGKGVQVHHYSYPAVWFTAFNMKDPVVGGYTAERVALRRAISLAFDHQEAIDVAMYGAGLAAHGVVPPGVVGHDPLFRTPVFTRDLARSRALLDTYGYVDRNGDGWREAPDGKPLTFELLNTAEPRFRVWDELYAKAFASIGLRLTIRKVHQAEATRLEQTGKYQITFTAWNMDYPDAEDFYVILHGPAAGYSNVPHFALPAFDRLFEQSKKLADSPQRSAIYRQLDKLVAAYMPVSIHLHLQRSAVTQPWLTGYMPHSVHLEPWKYLDIDLAKKAKWGAK
jgi:ABC-type transport system substrate-binding protein